MLLTKSQTNFDPYYVCCCLVDACCLERFLLPFKFKDYLPILCIHNLNSIKSSIYLFYPNVSIKYFFISIKSY